MNADAKAYHPGTIKTVAEIYGFDEVIIVGRKQGQKAFVGSYGGDKQHAGCAERLAEFLQHRLQIWDDAEMDKVLSPPEGASS